MKTIKAIFLILFALLNFSCSHKTQLTSELVMDKSERIDLLNKEVKLPFKVQNTEFDLFNANGFSHDYVLLPGASSICYKFVAKVFLNDISKWKINLVETKGNLEKKDWIYDLIKIRPEEWKFSSKPNFYTSKDSQRVKVILFEKEGIFFKCILQN